MVALSTITIKELTGAKRRVVLRGPSLPFQAARWGGEQRVVTTWYPGNALEATQHVLGPIEKTSSWDGVWRTTQMFRMPAIADEGGGDRQIVRAFTLKTLLEDIFRLGQRLRVEWANKLDGDTTTRRIIREGRATEWEFDYDRADDIGWSIAFDWSSRGARQQKAVASRQEDVQASLQSSLLAAANVAAGLAALSEVFSTITSIPGSASTFSLGDFENIVDAPLDLAQQLSRKALQISNRFKQVGDLIQKVRTLPTQLANQALDIASTAISVANQFADQMSSKPPEQNVFDTKVGSLTKTAEAFGELIAKAGTMSDAAVDVRDRVKEASKSESAIIAVHIARGTRQWPVLVDGVTTLVAGESLLDVSTSYYGTVDNAAAIAQASALPVNQQFVERGTILIIPKLDKIQAIDVEGT